jgi:hypothetical protein
MAASGREILETISYVAMKDAVRSAMLVSIKDKPTECISQSKYFV